MISAIEKQLEKDWIHIEEGLGIPEVISLNEKVAETFNTADVQYFVGNPSSKVVMVHLNPYSKYVNKVFYEGHYNNAKEHFNFYKNFGTEMYLKKEHKSPFDRKTLRFIKATGLMNFDRAGGDENKELEILMNDKFQIELLPYGSQKFNFKNIPEDILNNHILRVFDWISKENRDIVLFCGKVFEYLFSKKGLLGKSETKQLPLSSGKGVSKYHAKIISVSIPNSAVKAFVLSSFAMQGLNQVEYGKFLKEINTDCK